MDESPTNIMSAQPWNTVAERNILMDLMELLLKAMEKDNGANVGNLDNYLMGFWTKGQHTTHTPLFSNIQHMLLYSSCLWQNIM
jgi:hypothetical protein